MIAKIKLKSFLKKSFMVVLSVVLVVGCLMPYFQLSQKAYADSSSVVYSNYKNQAKRGNVSFNDISSKDEITDSATLYRKAVESQLDDWALLACGIYANTPERDDSDSCRNMWDDHHSNGKNWNSFNSDIYTRVYDRLRGVTTGRKDAGGNGDVANSDGLKFGNSLKDAAYGMCTLFDDNNRKYEHAEAFMTHVHLEPLIKDDKKQTVLYTNVAIQDAEGGTGKKHYNGFGICFYDFKINLLSIEDENSMTGGANVPYDTEICYDDNNNPINHNSESNNIQTKTRNEGEISTTQSVSLSTSDSDSVTAESSYGQTNTYGQAVGFSLNFGDCIGIGDQGKSSAPAFTLNCDFTFEQAYSKAFSDSNTTTKTYDKSTTVDITTPPHTAVSATTSINESHVKERVSVPVGITYKVGIYCCNGMFYDIGCKGSNWAPYKQNGFATFFGEDSTGPDSAICCGDAHTDLFVRSQLHRDDLSYDHSYSCLYTDMESHPSKIPYAIPWKTVGDDVTAYSNDTSTLRKTPQHAIDRLIHNYAMSKDGTTMDCRPVTSSTTINKAVPLYKIKNIYPVKKNSDVINMSVNTNAEVNYKVRAIDEEDLDYYGFDSNTDGQWEIVDSNGKKTSSQIAHIETDIRGVPIIYATGPGTVYIKYFIKENHLKTYGDPEHGNYGEYSTNSEITSNALQIDIKEEVDPATIPTSINVEGSPSIKVGEAGNLNDLYSVSVYNNTGKEIISPITWEQKELDSKGIHVDANGSVQTSKSGTFHVRACTKGASGVINSEWVELKSEDATVENNAPQSNSSQSNTNNSNNDNKTTASNVQPTDDLLDLAMSACGKIKEGSANGMNASVSTKTTYVKDGKTTTITADDVKAKLEELGINKDEFYGLVVAYNIGKQNGKVPDEVVQEIDGIANSVLDHGQRSQLQATSRAFALNKGLLYSA